MKFWITKYALTEGVSEIEGEIPDISPSMLCELQPDGRHSGRYFHGKDWHRTYEDAQIRAEEMRAAKLESLRKALKKIESLSFKKGEVS